MSALAGCYWSDGQPAHTDDLRISTAAAARRAHGPFHSWSSGPVALAYGHGDRRRDPQPVHDPVSALACIVDGRLDHLADVAPMLGLDRNASPTAVAMAAYRRWGLALGAHLLGDFVILIYDERERRLLCVRDPLGQRPLFYGTGVRGVVLGSEMQQVVRHPAIASEINEAMIAEHLTDAPATVTETVWRNVHRLPPAHALEIAPGGIRLQRYWDVDPDARVQYSDDGAYDEAFRDRFSRAIACRLRDADRVGLFLSGGLDSSAIAGVAQALRAEASQPPLYALTVAYPGQACDETPYSQAVIEMWGLPAIRVEGRAPSRESVVAQARQYLDLPAYANSLAATPLRCEAAANEIDVVLSGFGGDELFAADAGDPHALLRRGQVVGWARAMVSARLSTTMRQRLRPIFGSRPPAHPWIRADFARRVDLEARLRPRPTLTFPTRDQQLRYDTITSLLQILGDEMEDRAAHDAGIDQRHPFYDRRLVEFGLALPSSQRGSAHESKILLRRALARYLPPLVRTRPDKAEFSHTCVEALEALGGREALTHLQSEQAGWVDGTEVRDMYERMIALYTRRDDAYIALTGPLWAVAVLEMWLREARPRVGGDNSDGRA